MPLRAGVAACLAAAIALLMGPGFPVRAQPAEEAAAREPALSVQGGIETRKDFTLGVDGEDIAFVAKTGRLTVPAGETDGPRGRMFYVAYTRTNGDTAPTRRPVTFVFNGGPGAAAAYLHIGLMGPQRLAFLEDGRVPAAPRLVDNTESWLRFTDLVFIDPIGTGFSRAIGDEDAGPGPERRRDGGGGGGAPARALEADAPAGDAQPFWATEKDLDTLASFIRLYLSREDRWLSPVFLVGESYGGFRAARLGEQLVDEFGISVRGLVMVSPALEFGLLSDDRFRLLTWVGRMPSYAAAHLRHQGAGAASATDLAEAEAFAREVLLPALFAGVWPDDGAQRRRLASFIGLPEEFVRRYGGKIPAHVFATRLLRDQQRILSLYDASISFPAPHPIRPYYSDPRLARISAAVTMAFNAYVRERLEVKTELPYEVLNRRVSPAWRWREGRGRAGPPGSGESLESAMKTVPELRVLLAHGVYDLVTPYFTSEFVVNQLHLDAALRERITLRNYEGGHMFYSHDTSRKAFFRDARALYEAILPPAP